MGMMVVLNRGKGIADMELTPDMPFDVKALKEHPIKDFLTETKWAGIDFAHEKEFTPAQKIYIIGWLNADYIYEADKLKPEEWEPAYIADEIDDSCDWERYSMYALAPIYEVEYGYPAGTFRSVMDYEDNKMLYLRVMFPFNNPELTKRFSGVTRDMMGAEMNEFMRNVTGEDKKYPVGICEEWWKD